MKPSSAGSSVTEAATVSSDGERGGDGDAVEEAQPQDQHAEQRHAHRAAGEDHRPAGGGDGLLGGPGDGQAAFEALCGAG